MALGSDSAREGGREGGKERRRGRRVRPRLGSWEGVKGREGERERRREERAHSFAQLESATGGNGPAAAGAKRRPAAAGAWVSASLQIGAA